MFSKWRQIIVKHLSSSVVSLSSSSLSACSFWYESLAMMRNFPIAGNSSSGRRLRCGPRSFLMSCHNGGWSKSKFNCSAHISTKPATNWRKQLLSFFTMRWNIDEGRNRRINNENGELKQTWFGCYASYLCTNV